MKKINYKGRCEKRKVSKCEDICRTYSKIQSAMVDILEKDDEVASFECNVCLIGVAEDLYSTDFMIKKTDGSPDMALWSIKYAITETDTKRPISGVASVLLLTIPMRYLTMR